MIENINGYFVLSNEIPLQKGNTLQDLLELGARVGVLINTHHMRGIGKTYNLIQFAKKYGYVVVENNKEIVEYFKKIYDYDKIFSINDPFLIAHQQVVVDEIYNLDELKNKRVNIITGFFTDYGNKQKEFDLLSSLQYEVRQLNTKIKQARESENWGTYKNLIQSLRAVLELMDNISNKKDIPINYNFVIESKINDTEQLIKDITSAMELQKIRQ
jgi:hypothetical protein